MSEVTDENMLPESSPGEKNKSGVRKVNNVPLYILAAVIAAFILVMMFVASDRAAKQNKPPEEKALKTVGSATMFANEIAGQHESGIILAEGQTQPVIPENGSLVASNASNINQQDRFVPPPAPGELNTNNRSNSYSGSGSRSRLSAAEMREEDMIRFKMMRLQMLEEAVKASSSVQGFRSGGSTSNSPKNQLSSVRQQLINTGAATTPANVYQSKMEELKSLINGGASTGGSISGLGDGSGSSNTKQAGLPTSASGTGGDRWKLNSQIEAPETPFVLRAGFIIPGLLITGINSDLPGQISAQVSQDVYDTATGRYLLIPQGSRLVGAYSSQVAYGQSRVLVAWDRIIFPDGKALDIGGMQGADSAGYSGYKDKVNNHFWKVFSSAFLMSGIVAGVSLSQDTAGGDSASNRQRASDAMSQALGQQLGQAMTQMIMKNLNIAPTIEIRPGYRFNVVVNKDMVFYKPYESFDYQ